MLRKEVISALFWFISFLGIIPLISLLSSETATDLMKLNGHNKVFFSSSHPYFSPIMFTAFFIGAFIASHIGGSWRLIFLMPLFISGLLPLTDNSGWSVAGAIIAFKKKQCPVGWEPYEDARGNFLLGVVEKNHVGKKGGKATIKLNKDQLPAHVHKWDGLAGGGKQGLNTKGGTIKMGYGRSTTPKGKGEDINIMPPYVTVLYCVRK